MTVSQLIYALTLHKEKSYVKAAKVCGVTQPAMTLQIKQLEEELGILLFDRSRKPLQTTEAGEILVERAARIMEELDSIRDQINALKKIEEGKLDIGIIPTVGPYLMPLFLEEFEKQFPRIQLRITEDTTENLLGQLRTNYLSAVIMATPVAGASFTHFPLFYEKFFLYVSEEHQLHNQDLVGLQDLPLSDVWVLSEGNCFGNQVKKICEAARKGSSDGFYYQSNSIESLRRIVDHRRGITFLPELATLSIPPEKESMIKDLAGEPPVREISLVVNHSFAKKALLEALMDVIVKNVPKSMRPKQDNVIETGIRL